MLGQLAPVGVILLLGIVWQWLAPGGMAALQLRRAINTLNIYLLIPGLIMHIMAGQPLLARSWQVPLAGFLVIGGCLALSALTYRAMGERLAPAGRGAMILAASFGNGVGIALPVVVALYGVAAGQVPILYTLLASVPLAWTVGVAVAVRHAGYSGGAPMWRQLLRSPPLLTVLLALALRAGDVALPPLALKLFAQLADAALPLVIFVVGLSLNLRGLNRAWGALPALIIKCLVSPLLALGVGLALGMEGAALGALVITAATASFNVGIVLADRYDLDIELYALAVAVSATAYLLLAPLCATLVRLVS